MLASYYGYNQETKRCRSGSSIKVSTGRDFRQAGSKGEIVNHDKHFEPDRVTIISST